MKAKAGLIAAIASAIACAGGTAMAQGAPHDAVAAEAAFAEARALLRQGNYAEACPKLETSYALDPALGTLLNLGDCFERTGRTASAWVRYREAAGMAVQQNQREREGIARVRIAALEPRLCRLVVEASDRPGLEVRRDGALVASAALGLPVPIDPGPHVVEASAPGGAPFRARIDVKAPERGAPCPQSVVAIPAILEGERAAPAAAPRAPLSPTAIDLGPPTSALAGGGPSPPSTWRAPHTVAVAVAAGGLVAMSVTTIFALQASGTKSDADARCTTAGCTPEGKTLLADAGQSADIATVTFVIGAALLTTGAVLWLVSPSLRSSSSASASASATTRVAELAGGLRF